MIRVTSLQSAEVRVQKKLPANRSSRFSHSENVQAIVVLPVPAIPFIQYTAGVPLSHAHLTRLARISVRVPWVQVRLLIDDERLESYAACSTGFSALSRVSCGI